MCVLFCSILILLAKRQANQRMFRGQVKVVQNTIMQNKVVFRFDISYGLASLFKKEKVIAKEAIFTRWTLKFKSDTKEGSCQKWKS